MTEEPDAPQVPTTHEPLHVAESVEAWGEALAPAVQPPPERVPFWGYSDLLIFAGLAIPCMLLGFGVIKVAFWIFHLHPAVKTWELLAAQLGGYGFLLGTLAAIFRTQYDRPFWRSLAWTTPELPFYSVLTAGVGLAIGILLLGTLIRIPQTRNPLTDLLKDPTSLILIAIFGSIVAPVCEELVFRGFLQPLLVRSLGMAAGILATALPFGLLHFQEYGNSWRHVLLISISGVAFGCMRHFTGSTKAAAGMHAAYNAFQFVLLVMAKNLPQHP
jgi:uncharacterized protein